MNQEFDREDLEQVVNQGESLIRLLDGEDYKNTIGLYIQDIKDNFPIELAMARTQEDKDRLVAKVTGVGMIEKMIAQTINQLPFAKESLAEMDRDSFEEQD